MTPREAEQQMTEEQLDTLRHMLGINDLFGRPPIPHRDYYCANPGDPKLHELARLGKVRMYSAHGGYEWFCCTDEGKAEAIASVPTYSRGRKRYLDWLRTADATNLTFGEFLKRKAVRQ